MKKIGIYKITNTVNNHIYIGLSRNLKKRIYLHKWHLRNNVHENDHLQKAWNKYGEDAFLFEIIEECEEEKINERELYWINYYGGFTNPNLYNIRDGGDSLKHSEETIEKIRISNLGNPCYWKGKHLPQEVVDKISASNKGRKLTPEQAKKASAVLKKYWKNKPGYWKGKTMSEEHRRKLSESHLGQVSWCKGKKGIFTEETIKKIREANIGRHHTEETKIKISVGHLGKKKSEETKKRMSEAQKGKSRRWITKNGINTTVSPEKLDLYLSQGWKMGREEPRCWVTNGRENVMIKSIELEQYINNGWKRGRTYAPRNISR